VFQKREIEQGGAQAFPVLKPGFCLRHMRSDRIVTIRAASPRGLFFQKIGAVIGRTEVVP
jgi:hypothetical protein